MGYSKSVELSKDVRKIGEKLIKEGQKYEDKITKILVDGANNIRNEILRSMMSEPKTGRLYRKGVNRSILHRASAI